MIEHYQAGVMTIDGQQYQNDIMIDLNGEVKLWSRLGGGKRVTKEDVMAAVKEQPDQIIIGTGAHDMVEVAEEASQYIIDKKIDLSTEPIERAIEKYNQAKKEEKRVIGLFVLVE